MAFHFHSDKKLYFKHQCLNTEKYVIPFIETVLPLRPEMKVVEVGCGEGGVLKAFVDRGCEGLGVELDNQRVELFKQFMADSIAAQRAKVVQADIYDMVEDARFKAQFDLIVFKDVIEHIHNQARLLQAIKYLLAPQGMIFLGFPPWQMPFGGHQQICQSKILSKTPYIHLLPRGLYAQLLRVFKESDTTVEALLEVWDTGISIERFERICKMTGYELAVKRFYLINPIYELKFGLKPRKQLAFLAHLPFLRNFVTTCVYYLIKPRN